MLILAASSALEIFPVSGLDRSLHAPVFVGLIFLTFFRETLGWSYAGLVVPGYLATVFTAAPITGGLVVFESIITYLIATLLGRTLPRAGYWSTAFGRERFFLVILVAVIVRLVIEGSLLPWLNAKYALPHSRQLYSLGLVLVPLLANTLWNTGLRIALPRVAFLTGATYLVVVVVLLGYTNFTISRFQLANENVSLQFLESPHAHIILVVGALLAARGNVRYGWDYNGILVPALLAVAWYVPVKLVTTVIEALVVYAASRAITSLPPLSRYLIVGPRRLIIAFSVGFALKFVLGFTTARWWPELHSIDYFGFGYLLPSLLAVKMWDRQRVGPVLMPTIQISIVAFVLGNGIGYGLSAADAQAQETTEKRQSIEPGYPVPIQLMLGDTAPAPIGDAIPVGPTPAQRVAQLAREARHGDPTQESLARAAEAGLRVARDPLDPDRWLVVTPRAEDPDADRLAPRVAVRGGQSSDWLVVVDRPAVGSPLHVLSYQVARALKSPAIVVRSRLPAAAGHDDALITELHRALGTKRSLSVARGGERPALSVVREFPRGLDLTALGRALGARLEVDWRPPAGDRSGAGDSPRLVVPELTAERLAAVFVGAHQVDSWPEPVRHAVLQRLPELARVPSWSYRARSIEELRLFSDTLVPALNGAVRGRTPGVWSRALAAQLSYRFARIGRGEVEAWALFEPASKRHRLGNPTWLVRRGPRSNRIGIEVPAPGWETGTAEAAVALYGALSAEMMVFAGAPPDAAHDGSADVRRSTGRRSLYQRIHEYWLGESGRVISVNGIAPDRTVESDVIVSFGRPVDAPTAGPNWSHAALQMFSDSGLRVHAFDGSRERADYSGATDAPLAYAKRFAPDQAAVLWLGQGLRSRLTALRRDRITAARLARAGVSVVDALPLERASAAVARQSPSCDFAATQKQLDAYAIQKNPHLLRVALSAARRCEHEVLRDPASGQIWLLLAGTGEVRLFPMRGASACMARGLASREAVRRTIGLGLCGFSWGGGQ